MVEYSTEMEPQTSTTSVSDDARMIEAIVREKDRGAFAELVKRFEQPAFQLGLHITGCRALAEEAVQDAMLAVWHGAETFRLEGDLRRWILGIVAHRALRCARMERKSRKAKGYERERQRAEPQRQRPEESAERGELLGALRELLSHLPDAERKLVALYYGAGMTQEEIGAALNLSQRTVSFKLQACLERLRKSLARAGMAAAVPLLTPQLFGRVFESAPEAAQGLAERILANCDTAYAPRGNSGRSERAAAAYGSSRALVVASALVLALAAAAYLAQGRAPAPHGEALAARPSTEEASSAAEPLAPPPSAELRTWTFDFDKPVPEGFDYMQGDWRQGTYGAQHRTGLIAGAATLYNAFQFPDLDYRLPLKATVRFQRLNAAPINVGLGWSDGKRAFSARKWPRLANLPEPGTDIEFCSYFLGPYTVSTMGDWVGTVCKDIEPVDRSRMFFTGGNIALESIEIRELATEEIPPNIRDVEALIRSRPAGPTAIQGNLWNEDIVKPLAQYLKAQGGAGRPEKQGK